MKLTYYMYALKRMPINSPIVMRPADYITDAGPGIVRDHDAMLIPSFRPVQSPMPCGSHSQTQTKQLDVTGISTLPP